MNKLNLLAAAAALTLLAGPAFAGEAQPAPMTFFVTSTPLDGGNLGGLAGADAHCKKLATAVGAGNRTWRAYLSTQGAGAVNARDRIGKGPWHNSKGVEVAKNISHLHGDTLEEARVGNRIYFTTAITEQGKEVSGHDNAIDIVLPGEVNRHDILTGSTREGRAFTDAADRTCKNWTSNKEGIAQLGHHNRVAWNSAHTSRDCSLEGLKTSGGGGLFYCFAAD